MNGTVVEINAELVDAPQKLNEDPYGEGWLCIMAPDDVAAMSIPARCRRTTES